jgi:nucleotide-binding universal stress UspA family protein
VDWPGSAEYARDRDKQNQSGIWPEAGSPWPAQSEHALDNASINEFQRKDTAMSYKTILVHVDRSRHAEQRMRIAADLALRHDAHLIGAAATGLSRYIAATGGVNMQDPALTQHLDFLRRQADAALAGFETVMRAAGVPSWERQLVEDEPGGGISLLARYADLVLLSQTDLDEALPGIGSDFPEYVLLNSGRPVLLLPYAGKFDSIAMHALLAWDGSLEASRAITGALPLLHQAQDVKLVVFNAQQQVNMHSEQPGADIALYLARHGVTVEALHETTQQDSGNALLSLAADTGADLLVMGCYVHSRFREMLLGGASRTVLESMTLPVLMAH